MYACSLGPRGGPGGQHERGEAVAAAGQVDGGAAAKQHLRGGVVAQSDALVQRALLRLKCLRSSFVIVAIILFAEPYRNLSERLILLNYFLP